MKHMGLTDRIEIYARLGLGDSQLSIAELLGYNQSSIGKEIRRGLQNGKYDPIYANNLAKERRKQANISHTKLFKGNLWRVIEEKLKDKNEDWSPDTIIGRMKEEGLNVVCEKTVYNYIHNHSSGTKVLLRHGRKGYKQMGKVERRGTMGNILRIDQRPEEVELRKTSTYWEADTIISGTRKARLVTLVERKSRYIGIKKLPADKH